ncbi:retrovirus-related pol polyprotein from transposon TNT 1-94 [Tanacetum coccineum]|uniref:Retrovirus-related pol polyprotein from transposon TNT 1-94 n=1 Tax=Tanacetum coccineum TaxID=301880 RepID=A0ABQ5H695_9ASTR
MKLQTESLQQKLTDQISENNKLRAQLKGKFFESQTNNNGTSVNTNLFKPSTSGTKLYSVTPFPKSKNVPIGKDHFAAIMGYGDLQMGNILISRVYGRLKDSGILNLFSVGLRAVVVLHGYTQNQIPIPHQFYDKTPYELLRDRKLELKYLYVFGALCYPTNNFKDLGKLRSKANIGIFIGYSPSKKAYQIYNKSLNPNGDTRQLMEKQWKP